MKLTHKKDRWMKQDNKTINHDKDVERTEQTLFIILRPTFDPQHTGQIVDKP